MNNWQPPAPRAAAFQRDVPLDFSLTSNGLALTGHTNSSEELLAFLVELERFVALLPESKAAAEEECSAL